MNRAKTSATFSKSLPRKTGSLFLTGVDIDQSNIKDVRHFDINTKTQYSDKSLPKLFSKLENTMNRLKTISDRFQKSLSKPTSNSTSVLKTKNQPNAFTDEDLDSIFNGLGNSKPNLKPSNGSNDSIQFANGNNMKMSIFSSTGSLNKIVDAINMDPKSDMIAGKIWEELTDSMKDYNYLVNQIREKEKLLEIFKSEKSDLDKLPNLDDIKAKIPDLKQRLIESQDKLDYLNLYTDILLKMRDEKRANITYMKKKIMREYGNLPKIKDHIEKNYIELLSMNKKLENYADEVEIVQRDFLKAQEIKKAHHKNLDLLKKKDILFDGNLKQESELRKKAKDFLIKRKKEILLQKEKEKYQQEGKLKESYEILLTKKEFLEQEFGCLKKVAQDFNTPDEAIVYFDQMKAKNILLREQINDITQEISRLNDEDIKKAKYELDLIKLTNPNDDIIKDELSRLAVELENKINNNEQLEKQCEISDDIMSNFIKGILGLTNKLNNNKEQLGIEAIQFSTINHENLHECLTLCAQTIANLLETKIWIILCLNLLSVVYIVNTQSCSNQQLIASQTYACGGSPSNIAASSLTLTTAKQFSIGFWVQPNSFCTSSDNYLQMTIQPSSTIILYSFTYDSSPVARVKFQTTASTGIITTLTQAMTMTAANWYYILGSLDLQAGQFFYSAYSFTTDVDHTLTSSVAYNTAWTIGTSTTIRIGYNVMGTVSELIVIYSYMTSATNIRQGLSPTLSIFYMFNENIGYTVGDSSLLNNQAYFGTSTSSSIGNIAWPIWAGTNGLSFPSGSNMITMSNVMNINTDALSWKNSWIISFWIKRTGSSAISNIFEKKRADGITNVLSIYLDTSNYPHLAVDNVDCLLGTSYMVPANVFKLLTISINYQAMVLKFRANFYEGNVFKLSNTLTLSTNLDEQLNDVLRLGDQVTSFIGYLKHFKLFTGTTFISTSSCLTNCQISIGVLNPICLGYSTAPSCPSTQYVDSVINDCIKCQSVCSTCTDLSTCTGCNTPYEQSTTNCDCPAILFPNTTLGTCDTCTSYNENPIQCLTCLPGYYISSGVCSLCDSSCLTCDGGTINNCLTCSSPLVLNQSTSACEIPVVITQTSGFLNAIPIKYSIGLLHDPTQIMLKFTQVTPILIANISQLLTIKLKGISSSIYPYTINYITNSSNFLIKFNYAAPIPLLTVANFSFYPTDYDDINKNYSITPSYVTTEIQEYYPLSQDEIMIIQNIINITNYTQLSLLGLLLVEVLINAETSNTYMTMYSLQSINYMKYLFISFPPNYDKFFDEIDPYPSSIDFMNPFINEWVGNINKNTTLEAPRKLGYYHISPYFIDNFGTRLALILGFSIICLGLQFTLCFKMKLKKHEKVYRVLCIIDHSLRWNIVLNYFLINYLPFCVFLFAQFENYRLNPLYDKINLIVASICIPFICIFGLTGYMSNFNYKLSDPKAAEIYNEVNRIILEDEDDTSDYEKLVIMVGRFCFLHKDLKVVKVVQQLALTFLIFRSLIKIVIIYTMSGNYMIQVYFLLMIDLSVLIYLIYFKPFSAKFRFWKIIINEMLILLSTIFTLYIATAHYVGYDNMPAKLVLGWSFIWIYVGCVGINGLFTLYEIILYIRELLHKRRAHKRKALRVMPLTPGDQRILINEIKEGEEDNGQEYTNSKPASLDNLTGAGNTNYNLTERQLNDNTENEQLGYKPLKRIDSMAQNIRRSRGGEKDQEDTSEIETHITTQRRKTRGNINIMQIQEL